MKTLTQRKGEFMMKLQSITSPNLINVESEFSSKNELIRYLTKQLIKQGNYILRRNFIKRF